MLIELIWRLRPLQFGGRSPARGDYSGTIKLTRRHVVRLSAPKYVQAITKQNEEEKAQLLGLDLVRHLHEYELHDSCMQYIKLQEGNDPKVWRAIRAKITHILKRQANIT